MDQCDQRLVHDGWARTGTVQKEDTDLAATLCKQCCLPIEDLSSIAMRRCSLFADCAAVVVTATLLFPAADTYFHSAKSDICR